MHGKHSCCSPGHAADPTHHHDRSSRDWLFIICATIVLLALGIALILPLGYAPPSVLHFAHATRDVLAQMSWGILLAFIAVGIVHRFPAAVIPSLLSSPKNGANDSRPSESRPSESGQFLPGLYRATLAGVALDLCSHGILLVGMKLYKQGATLGQTMAFLIASPWNSLSLTIILASLIGIPWTVAFVILSAFLAITTGYIFEILVQHKILPENPAQPVQNDIIPRNQVWKQIVGSLPRTLADWRSTVTTGILESKSILRWLLLGIVITAMVRAFLTPEQFTSWFAPNSKGLFDTLFFATIFEACSEGSAPIAGDLLTIALAPGNAFAFLMVGVATDITEILAIRETTNSWRTALALPLILVPQVVIVAIILNSL